LCCDCAGDSCQLDCGADGLVPDAAGLHCVEESEDLTNQVLAPGQEPGMPATNDDDTSTGTEIAGNATSQPPLTEDLVNVSEPAQKLVAGSGNATKGSNATSGVSVNSSATLNVTTPSSTACDNDITPCFNGGLCSSLPGQFPDFNCSCINGFAGKSGRCTAYSTKGICYSLRLLCVMWAGLLHSISLGCTTTIFS